MNPFDKFIGKWYAENKKGEFLTLGAKYGGIFSNSGIEFFDSREDVVAEFPMLYEYESPEDKLENVGIRQVGPPETRDAEMSTAPKGEVPPGSY